MLCKNSTNQGVIDAWMNECTALPDNLTYPAASENYY